MKMLLEVNQVCKSFGSNQVLKDISFDVREGEVHALIGENGAGKSTLIKIIGGIYQADSGEVSIEGKVLHLQNPIQAMEHGISIVHQELSLAQNLSVAENIFMRRELVNGIGFIRWNDIKARSAEIFEQIGISIDPSIQVNLLSIGMQQVVEIAKAISMKARIIFMDEPTSSLSEKEISRLFTLIRELKRQKVSVVYISHKINEIIEISDRVSVLRDGNLVWTKDTVDITANQIISAMVGRELNQIYPQRSQSVGDSIMICEHLSRFGTFHDISFQVQRGEILGFYGLVGAGRSEVVRCIVGADTLTSGTITLDGKVVKMKTPRSALRQGVAYLSEDRKQLGLFLDFSAKDNIVSA
ncbi:MAG: sugar ABC transporter ATP-binding protein, partial [Raoultibacter sp.]